MEHPGELRDTRRTYTFYMDDALIDHFAPQIGVTGLAVYALLARHAKQGRAFPAWTRIARQLGIGRATVQRALTTLETAGLITIEKRKSPRGDKATSLYILQDLSHLRNVGSAIGYALVQDDAEVISMRGSVADHATTLDKDKETDESPYSMRGSVADYRGSVADYPLRSEGISLKEAHLKEEDNLYLGSTDSAGVETSTPAVPPLVLAEMASPAKKSKQSPKPKPAKTPWLLDDPDIITFHDWITTQSILKDITPPVDYEWWCNMSEVIHGLPALEWLGSEYAGMQMWLRENPSRKPMPGNGTSRFVRNWLKKAYSNDRRQRLPNSQAKEVHYHYDNTGRRR